MHLCIGHCTPCGNVDLDAYATAGWSKSAKILALFQQTSGGIGQSSVDMERYCGLCWLCTDDDCVIVPTVRHHGLTLDKYACITKTKSSNSTSSSSTGSTVLSLSLIIYDYCICFSAFTLLVGHRNVACKKATPAQDRQSPFQCFT